MTKLSPTKLQAVVMGMWFLASAYGQYFAGLFGAGIASASQDMQSYDKMLTYTEGFKLLGVYSLVIGVVVVLASPFIRKLMGAVK
jgi:POT family proton-dependent oligopeptide transporter